MNILKGNIFETSKNVHKGMACLTVAFRLSAVAMHKSLEASLEYVMRKQPVRAH